MRTQEQVRALSRAGLAGMAVPRSVPDPLDTRVGGPLIVPKGKKAPTNQFGKPLLQLLLLRLSDLPRTEGNVLPESGWIQVLIEPDDPLDIPDASNQSAGFRVIQFEDGTAFDVSPVDPTAEGLDMIWNGFAEGEGVMSTGLSLTFEPVIEIAPNTHYKLERLPDGRRTKAFEDAFDAQYNALENERISCDVMIGGQAAFTQDDIRFYSGYGGLENLIRMSGSGQVFLWGDVGEANILVPVGDLGTGNLGNAVFHLDFH